MGYWCETCGRRVKGMRTHICRVPLEHMHVILEDDVHILPLNDERIDTLLDYLDVRYCSDVTCLVR